MSLRFDQDGEPILTEKDQREEFAVKICGDCITNEDGSCERERLGCWLVRQALEHYDAWGGYNCCGYISCPPCPKCGVVASTTPVYSGIVGELCCTQCGHTWYELPREWDDRDGFERLKGLLKEYLDDTVDSVELVRAVRQHYCCRDYRETDSES